MSTIPTSADDAQQNRPLAGILFLVLACTVFPVQDVIIKSLSDTFAVHQIVFLRGVFALPLVAVIAHFDGGLRPFRIGPFFLQMARVTSAFSSYLFYYMALATLGMAETASITFSTPIFVTVFAMFFLGEKIGAFRWFAVILGLTGVVVIVQPGAGVFDPAAVLALLAAVTYAMSLILTRKIGNRAKGGSMTLFTLFVFVIYGGLLGLLFSNVEGSSPHPSFAFLYRAWIWPELWHWFLFAGLGCIAAIGFFSLAQAYRLAEASVVTPFEYTYLPWAILWGFLIFGTLPDMNTWIGLVMIVGAGLLIVFREASKGRKLVVRRGLGIMRQR
ncbi:DMT family transporter [Roseovarius faecimaris]|uniref:DMT family transporter n=1 Tax=Roseovarius faecimaris TaxID=2494550 RepID=A0A6I6IJF9_9RHOB|nr:DMT family transporter [Roseovarius faecimaris]QGX96969.1 DMT family transporter [Roseovarius faecimaris]